MTRGHDNHCFLRPVVAPNPDRDVHTWREVFAMLRSAWPITLTGLVVLVPFNAGIFFVRYFHGSEEAARFGVALQVANAYFLFAGLGTRTLFPHISGPFGTERSFCRQARTIGAVG